jgi:hypothetical protein
MVNALDEAGMANVRARFRMLIDTGTTMTVIPYFVRKNYIVLKMVGI